MLGIERLPIFVDLAYGVVGMWAGYDETSQEGMVVPKYFPHNTLQVVKSKEYPSAVPEEAIVGPVQPSGKKAKGRAPSIVVVTKTADGEPLMDKIDQQIGENLDRLRRQLEEAEWEKQSERRKRKEAKDEFEQEKRDKQSKKRSGGKPRFVDDGNRRRRG